jgi:hypothetical protein
MVIARFIRVIMAIISVIEITMHSSAYTLIRHARI